MCANCKGVERHRIIRDIYLPLRPLLSDWRVLHFAPDRSVDPTWFAEYTPSAYGGINSMDMMNTGLPDGSFELVASTHVLEHVSDDFAAIRETIRVVGPDGVIHLSVPTPTHRWETNDWGFADPKVNEHYRDYGADFPQRVLKEVESLKAASVAGFDPVTGAADLVYFFSQSAQTLEAMGRLWRGKQVAITRLY
jgi:SAM-dependent methyltransferase